ncbi:acyltransferase family protein [Paenibacillus marchantiophytorum]|uniref:acyltransferase family protein n=1 Tax=Paenibacillus marchantiophytorum TaxID=1619310 RepID=UPI00166A1022
MNKRYEELDSLRGLAALCVVFFHLYQVIPINKLFKVIFEYSPLRLFISGGESVVMFFVLSGFVLALPYFDFLSNLNPVIWSLVHEMRISIISH